MNSPTILPRSLTPLEDESLPGYLLRLSYRLEISPARLGRLGGLTRDAEQIPVRHLLQLTPTAAHALTRAFTLPGTAAQALTLHSLAAVYPPARRSLASAAPTWSATDGTTPWVLTNSSRYCPQCLAGDRTPIQQALGGAWRRAWRLPVVFACLRHGRFLDHACPNCASPALSFGKHPNGRIISFGLLPASRNILHPAQCRARLPATRPPLRSEVCGGRLDSREPPDRLRPTTDLLNFQKRLLHLIGHESGADTDQARAAAYFADLNATLLLITASWPHASALLPDSPHLDVVDAHITGLRKMRDPQMRHAPRTVLLDVLPRDAAACASLLAAADALLALPDLKSHLTGLAAHARMPIAVLVKLARLHHPCSRPVQAAIEPWTAVLDQSAYSGRPTFPRLGEQLIRFEHRHVPQKLPDNWLTGFADRHSFLHRTPRRAAAVALVQLSGGGSHAGAAAYLGLSPGVAAALSTQISHWKTVDHHAQEFLDGLSHLVARLNGPDNQIDYEHRRNHLYRWQIPDEDWHTITSEAERQLANPRARPDWNEAKRLAATVAIWTQITQSEPRYAPALIRARHIAPLRSSTYPLMKALLSPITGPDTRISTHLKAALTPYADELAAAIDAAAPEQPATTTA